MKPYYIFHTLIKKEALQTLDGELIYPKPQFHISAYVNQKATRLIPWFPQLIPFSQEVRDSFGEHITQIKNERTPEEEKIDEFEICHDVLHKLGYSEDPRSATLRLYAPWMLDKPLQGKKYLTDEYEMPGLYDIKLSHSIIPQKIKTNWTTPLFEYIDVTGYVLFDPNVSENAMEQYGGQVGAQLFNAIFAKKEEKIFMTFPHVDENLIGVCVKYPTTRRMHHVRKALRRYMRLTQSDAYILQDAADALMDIQQSPQKETQKKDIEKIVTWLHQNTKKSAKLDKNVHTFFT